MLSMALRRHSDEHAVAVAVPRGGVPVAYAIARAFTIPLDVVIPRKLPIPEEPEAGFGAVTPDGTVVLNEKLVARLSLPQRTIDAIVREALREVRRRQELYRQPGQGVSIVGRTVMLVDDGLASGYTMLAAIRSIRRESPSKVIVAVPCAPAGSIDLVRPESDEVCCLVQSEESIFAVASFYEDFHDLSDEEVIGYLRRGRAIPA